LAESADLERGRRAAKELDWADAYDALSAADRSSPLGAEDLELLGTASYLLRRIDDCTEALQRSHQLHLAHGDNRRAVRCLFWVGFTLLNEGDYAQASGWLARAARLLEAEEEECAEHGFLMLPAAYQKVAIAGEYAAGREIAAGASEIAVRTGDADLLTMALNIRGRALIREGSVPAGLAMLDEAMVAVVAGELAPYVAGNIYCSLIEACHEVSELRRAHEWTDALSTWCDRHRGMVSFNGQCIVHRAEMMQQRGKWPEAIDETKTLFNRSLDVMDRYATGEALYRRGEIHRARGETKAAEEAFRGASEVGREPQPGLALLLLAQGKPVAAVSMIRGAVASTSDDLERARLLPVLIEVLIEVGDVPAARDAADELARLAVTYQTSVFGARADQAMGAVHLADGQPEAALPPLRRAWRVWRDIGLPYEEARVRALIGLGCLEIGDEDSATLELEAARQVFTRLGAGPALERLDVMTGGPVTAADRHGLTRRELEVLRLVATGKTNQAIADDLVVAVKTIDRHVSNIFTKLGVSSRAAATAFAYQHQLV
jgi:ATP/maltotriose-dependent transcriptional regulator MalT